MKSIFIVSVLLLSSGFVTAGESNKSDIECEISKGPKKLGTIHLDDSAKSVSFVDFKIDDKQSVEVACGIRGQAGIDCNAYLHDPKVAVDDNAVPMVASAMGLVKFGNGEISMFCSSISAIMEWNRRHSE